MPFFSRTPKLLFLFPISSDMGYKYIVGFTDLQQIYLSNIEVNLGVLLVSIAEKLLNYLVSVNKTVKRDKFFFG